MIDPYVNFSIDFAFLCPSLTLLVTYNVSSLQMSFENAEMLFLSQASCRHADLRGVYRLKRLLTVHRQELQ